MYSKSTGIEAAEFSKQTKRSSAYNVTRVSDLPDVIPLISGWVLSPTASGSRAISNNKGDNGSPCRTPLCSENGLDLFPFVMMEDLGFVYKIFTQSMNVLLRPNFSSVTNRYGHSIVSKALWASRESIAAPLTEFLSSYRILRYLRTLQKECLLGRKPVWSGCMI